MATRHDRTLEEITLLSVVLALPPRRRRNRLVLMQLFVAQLGANPRASTRNRRWTAKPIGIPPARNVDAGQPRPGTLKVSATT